MSVASIAVAFASQWRPRSIKDDVILTPNATLDNESGLSDVTLELALPDEVGEDKLIKHSSKLSTRIKQNTSQRLRQGPDRCPNLADIVGPVPEHQAVARERPDGKPREGNY
jgi:hypothetical protein